MHMHTVKEAQLKSQAPPKNKNSQQVSLEHPNRRREQLAVHSHGKNWNGTKLRGLQEPCPFTIITATSRPEITSAYILSLIASAYRCSAAVFS